MQPSTAGKLMRKRPQQNLLRLKNSPTIGRTMIVNHRLSRTENLTLLQKFLPQNFLPWIAHYLATAFTPRVKFPDYTKATNTGIYEIAQPTTRIAIAGDWGTGTQEAETIMNHMIAADPHLTIHLGDVYYVGDEPELEENCFEKEHNGFDGVLWRHGSLGSFALNGNHEMYANGGPYFRMFLPSLGMPSNSGQVASFFAINVGAWRILAVDTGYNSVGLPILSLIPGVNSIPAVGGDCHLESALMEWLRTVVRPQQQPKPTLILSHHQYYSAFADRAYTKPGRQLKEAFGDQEVVWLWGHEHRLAIYDRASKDNGITAFGRCIGHAGMPVEVGQPDPQKAPVEYFDPRSHILDGERVGENGFALLTIAQDVLTIEYRDIANQRIFAESFRPVNDGQRLVNALLDTGSLQRVTR
jgi:hypothetical protein